MKILTLTLTLFLLAHTAVAQDAADALRSSMVDKNFVTLERIERDALQELCSKPRTEAIEPEAAASIRQAALESVPEPGNADYLGDWARGEAVASNGRGLQYSDNPDQANGGNCYACHQLDPDELAYGTLGPSLAGYGARGQSPAMLQYTWAKLWNTHAYNVCSHMPRFGAAGILTEQQLRDVMAFLFAPESPVNRNLTP